MLRVHNLEVILQHNLDLMVYKTLTKYQYPRRPSHLCITRLHVTSQEDTAETGCLGPQVQPALDLLSCHDQPHVGRDLPTAVRLL